MHRRHREYVTIESICMSLVQKCRHMLRQRFTGINYKYAIMSGYPQTRWRFNDPHFRKNATADCSNINARRPNRILLYTIPCFKISNGSLSENANRVAFVQDCWSMNESCAVPGLWHKHQLTKKDNFSSVILLFEAFIKQSDPNRWRAVFLLASSAQPTRPNTSYLLQFIEFTPRIQRQAVVCVCVCCALILRSMKITFLRDRFILSHYLLTFRFRNGGEAIPNLFAVRIIFESSTSLPMRRSPMRVFFCRTRGTRSDTA